tara:strand:- start:1223 stop:1534 length:312 start_codon:yes stop_codon:yes gene_type:complete
MDNYISRYDFGSTKIMHKGKEIVTSINTNFFDNFQEVVEGDSFGVGTVKQYIQHRPDSISDIFYDNPAYWWYLLLYNNMSDPFNDLNASDPVLIPALNDFLRR